MQAFPAYAAKLFFVVTSLRKADSSIMKQNLARYTFVDRATAQIPAPSPPAALLPTEPA